MSDLANALHAGCMGQRVPIQTNKFIEVSDSFVEPLYGMQKVYEIGARLKYRVILKDDAALGHAVRTGKRAIVEQVFGEFRQDLVLIEHAIYNNEQREALDLLHSMRERMFKV